MSIQNVLFVFALCGSSLACMGCGGDADGLQELTGRVTYNGEPIPEGRIQFRSLDESQHAYAGVIQDGQYTVRVAPGPAAVEVRASRLIPGKYDESNPGEPVPVGEMYIPEKYNSRTELQVRIDESTVSEDFALEGKP